MNASMIAAVEVREQDRLVLPADTPNRSSGRRLLANALRVLAIDAVEAAKSGHPGMPMGMAEIAEALWRRHLRHNPADPRWPDRDRFVLSNGHGSMLLYALLHLTGYDLPMEELRRFRQLGSCTPGHPEYGVTPGVETTTGPLGQGLANAIGMALAERLLGAEFNRPGHCIVDHRTFCFVGDGCLMEGISHEACSLAGTLGLDKLVVFYDDNGISIDGPIAGWFTDDTPQRFEAYGWRVIRAVDGHDPYALDAAIDEALTPCGKPTLICCRTVIGHGSPNRAGSADVHGAPLGAAEAAATRASLGWTAPPFELPEEARAGWDARRRGATAQAEWQARFDAYANAHPQSASEFLRRMRGDLPDDFRETADAWVAAVAQKSEPMATRKASQQAIQALAGLLPELLGGSADLTGSTLTDWPGSGGRHLHYGVREFGMAAVMNGMALHGGFLPFGGTFLAFSDYARNGLRLSALMGVRVVYVFTHDGIGLGEDGPTHQPVEHAASLRLVPNLDVWRPCDALETAVAWRAAVERTDGPTALLLSRQSLPVQAGTGRAHDAVRGGYVLADDGRPELVLIATGSEVAIAMEAGQLLAGRGIATRVVSMPCCEVFDRQDPAWRRAVLPDGIPRLAIEAGATGLWRAYVGLDGAVVGLDRYGESAPAADLYRHFGITADAVMDCAQRLRSPQL
ncbi:transketolase [Azospirillum lipoferum]|uniref:Transketolase n=1 Tax=Azospirillum lipoferum TaxID=193 RepID=A0A5A9G3B5_AZOLI|nr:MULTISPECIES: transketolase [Azospirillum]KAA0589103.1 transketolase [Azospirillum lipoferum]MCP1613459.1 transketolase [Azospirillum lipoferum]MDW5533106.1 transketolase [Azospirillum sp. NL1]